MVAFPPHKNIYSLLFYFFPISPSFHFFLFSFSNNHSQDIFTQWWHFHHKKIYILFYFIFFPSLFSFTFYFFHFQNENGSLLAQPLSLTITYLAHLSLSNKSISHSPLILWYLFGLTQLLRKKERNGNKRIR